MKNLACLFFCFCFWKQHISPRQSPGSQVLGPFYSKCSRLVSHQISPLITTLTDSDLNTCNLMFCDNSPGSRPSMVVSDNFCFLRIDHASYVFASDTERNLHLRAQSRERMHAVRKVVQVTSKSSSPRVYCYLVRSDDTETASSMLA